MELTTEQCHQHKIKLNNLESDLESFSLKSEEVELIKLSDLTFKYIDKTEIDECHRIKNFIEKHEWLKKMPNRPTHRFGAYWREQLIAVNVLGTPYAKTNLLGPENWGMEKLIARGASISFAPSNIGSWLIMRSINWMVQNTNFRYFTSYCDTEAFELGSIYQACNFIYLGKKSGSKKQFYDINYPNRGWFSDRVARRAGQYKKFAKNLGIKWEKNWSNECKILWENIPFETQELLKLSSREYLKSCEVKDCPPKHKYVYVLGKNKKETKRLLEKFYSCNSQLIPKGPNSRGGYPYPKVRGQ
jgi:hypothetical protein